MVFLFKGIVPPGHFQATIDSGAPGRPNHHAHMRFYIIYIEPGTCALYEVTKHTLADQGRLCIFGGGLCCRRMVFADVTNNA